MSIVDNVEHWGSIENRPIGNFNFMLRVEGVFDLPCKAVHSFTKENEYDYVQEGGLNDYVHMLRKQITKPFTFTVERYAMVDEGSYNPLQEGADLILPLLLFVAPQAGVFSRVRRAYVFTGCTVMSREYGELDAEKSGLLTEKTTIGYRELIVVSIPEEWQSIPQWKFDGKKPQGGGTRSARTYYSAIKDDLVDGSGKGKQIDQSDPAIPPENMRLWRFKGGLTEKDSTVYTQLTNGKNASAEEGRFFGPSARYMNSNSTTASSGNDPSQPPQDTPIPGENMRYWDFPNGKNYTTSPSDRKSGAVNGTSARHNNDSLETGARSDLNIESKDMRYWTFPGGETESQQGDNRESIINKASGYREPPLSERNLKGSAKENIYTTPMDPKDMRYWTMPGDKNPEIEQQVAQYTNKAKTPVSGRTMQQSAKKDTYSSKPGNPRKWEISDKDFQGKGGSVPKDENSTMPEKPRKWEFEGKEVAGKGGSVPEDKISTKPDSPRKWTFDKKKSGTYKGKNQSAVTDKNSSKPEKPRKWEFTGKEFAGKGGSVPEDVNSSKPEKPRKWEFDKTNFAGKGASVPKDELSSKPKNPRKWEFDEQNYAGEGRSVPEDRLSTMPDEPRKWEFNGKEFGGKGSSVPKNEYSSMPEDPRKWEFDEKDYKGKGASVPEDKLSSKAQVRKWSFSGKKSQGGGTRSALTMDTINKRKENK